jgi:Trk K+ transport system NAD-binding subunit
MKRNRLVIIGIGRVGSELLRRLPKDYDLLCIDNAPDGEERVKKIRSDGVIVMQADATSRLVLKEARVDDSEAVLITTTSEVVNIEVCRLLHEHFRTKRIIALGSSSDGIRQLRELGAEVQELFSSSAIGIRNMLEQRSRAATAIGLGKNEILEVELHPHSRLANKPLRNLAPLRWKIGILYREGNIIIPRGDTVLRPKDRMILLGDPGVLKTVAEIMTFSFQKFPQEYGTAAVVYLAGSENEHFFAELEYLFTVFPLRRVIFVHSTRAAGQSLRYKELIRADRYPAVEDRTIDLPAHRALGRVAGDPAVDCGMIVLHGPTLRRGPFAPLGKRALLDLCRSAACPVLVCRGSHPYARTAVPAAEGLPPHHVLETALEVSSSLNNAVSALLVRPMRHIASDEDLQEYEAARKVISDLSIMYRADVRTADLSGNPVHAILQSIRNQSLLFIDSSGMSRQTWPFAVLNPDPAWHLIRRSPVTTMIVPPMEEAL